MSTGERALVYLSEKHFGDVFIHSFGHVGTLSRERTTSDPVLSSGTSAGLTKSSAAHFARIPSVLSTAGLNPQDCFPRVPCDCPAPLPTLPEMHRLLKLH